MLRCMSATTEVAGGFTIHYYPGQHSIHCLMILNFATCAHKTYSYLCTPEYLFKNRIMSTSIKEQYPESSDQWTDLSGSKHIVAFSPATYGRNPPRKDYIWGAGPQGIGYYHITTQTAYQLLNQKLRAKIRRIEGQIAQDKCCSSLWSCGARSQSSYGLQKEQELSQISAVHQIVAARARASKPFGIVGIPVSSKDSNVEKTLEEYYSKTGEWLIPDSLYNSVGDCGGYRSPPDNGGGGGDGGGGGGGASRVCSRDLNFVSPQLT